MKRPFIGTAAFAALVVVAGFAPSVSAQTQQPAAPRGASLSASNYDQPYCTSTVSTCADYFGSLGQKYVGHDEPSIEYKSGIPGSGNDMTYTVTLPKDPKKQPNASGSGGSTWNFELRPTFWFGL
ncbi:MAG TPA: hypothetical protein VEH31_13260, partial [Streptosporangiaceae bacterium]|nr:hypothetical protein [Streptosporangiaceae bacterium]